MQTHFLGCKYERRCDIDQTIDEYYLNKREHKVERDQIYFPFFF